MKTRTLIITFVAVTMGMGSISALLLIDYFNNLDHQNDTLQGSKEETESQDETQVLLVPSPFVDTAHDEIIQKLSLLTNDKNPKKTFEDKRKSVYTTDKGQINISKGRTYDYLRYVDYSLYGKENAIPKDQADMFVDILMNDIGYDRDGSEHTDFVDFGSRKEISIQQKKDGWIIQNEIHRFNFRDDSTSIELGRWYANLDEYKIRYSQDQAKQIAHDFIQSVISNDDNLRQMDLKVSYPDYAQMKIIYDRLVYSISGIYPHKEVLVDAHSGKIVNSDQITITGKKIPGCASVGVTRLVSHDVETLKKRTGTLLYYELTDADLKQLPVLKEMVDATNSRTEYNDRVLLPVSIEEWNQYDEFFKQKFDEQHEVYYEADLRSNNILYDDQIYAVSYNEHYEDTPLWVELLPSNFGYERKAITISEDELTGNAPKVIGAIEMMGTWEVSVRNSTGILESEQSRYGDYLHKKNIEKFGENAEQYAQIFYYNGSYYEPSFVIC